MNLPIPIERLPSPAMEQIGWQIIVRCRDDRVFAPPGNARLLYLDAVLTHGAAHGLYTHGLGDTHGHLATAGTRKQAGELARRLLLTLTQKLPGAPDFEPARILPIDNQRHLGNLVGYCLGQDKHHELGLDPLREATAAFDYLGLRPRGKYLRERLRTHLPRINDREILAHLPAALIESFNLDHLREAMHSCVASAATTDKPWAVAVRTAAVHAAAGASPSQIAAALGLSWRSVMRHRQREPDAELVRAIRLQMGLREGVSRLAERSEGASRPPSVAPLARVHPLRPSEPRFDSFDDFLMSELG